MWLVRREKKIFLMPPNILRAYKLEILISFLKYNSRWLRTSANIKRKRFCEPSDRQKSSTEVFPDRLTIEQFHSNRYLSVGGK